MPVARGRSSRRGRRSPKRRCGRLRSDGRSAPTAASPRRARSRARRIRGFEASASSPRTRPDTTAASWWSWCMRRPAERGVALVAVTMAVAVLAAVAVGMAVTATTGDRLAANALAVVQAEALARSGVAAARAALVDASRAGGDDTLGSPWLRPLPAQAIGAGVVSVEVEDEARRLDANLASDALPRLLARLRLDPFLADAILDWTDADDETRPHGAERRWYATRTPARAPANRPLASVGELLLVRGMDAGLLERLRPFLTVAGEDGVNPNTASPEVMLAMWP